MKINRRDFCAGFGSAIMLPVTGLLSRLGSAQAQELVGTDLDPAGGFTIRPPKEFLFTDVRHINPRNLRWLSPKGEVIHVTGSSVPPTYAVADSSPVPYGVRLVAQRASKEGPFEGLPNLVIYDDGLYRSWGTKTNYTGRDLGSHSKAEAKSLTVRYGESKDGYSWSWRDVSEVKISGRTGIDGQFFFIDRHGPAEERYKCIYNAHVLSNPGELWKEYQKLHVRYRDPRLSSDCMYCLFGMVSPDGLNWKAIDKPLTIHKGDTDNTVYYDEWLGKYVLYSRFYWLGRRMVTRAESDDFYRWSPPNLVLQPELDDPFYYDIYTNGRTSYPGLPGQHLMFPFFYNRYTQGSEIHLHSSIDGIEWSRVPPGPVLVQGDTGDWDGEFIVAGKNLVPLSNDRIGIPYRGSTDPHKYPRWPGVVKHSGGWATWPKGRLCAVVADEVGEFYTFMVQVTGRKLKLNAKVHRAGEIRVGLYTPLNPKYHDEVKEIKGRSADDCAPIIGDSLAHAVSWKGDSSLGREPGSKVILHFKLRAAELFGFEWV